MFLIRQMTTKASNDLFYGIEGPVSATKAYVCLPSLLSSFVPYVLP